MTERHQEANQRFKTILSGMREYDAKVQKEEEEDRVAREARDARARSEERSAKMDAERQENEARRARFQQEREAQAARHAEEMKKLEEQLQAVRTPSRRSGSSDRDQLATNPDEAGPVDPDAPIGTIWGVTGRQMGERMTGVQVLPSAKVSSIDSIWRFS
jgi:hypothetical protein